MAATSVGTGLWHLPAQPAPPSNVAGSAFVTIWAFVCTAFVVGFSSKLRGPNPAWPEFKNIRNPTILLAVWYTASAADRWIHYEQHALPYGYILFDAVNQVLQIVSTIWLLWGTYDVIWNELERRFTRKQSQGAWWLAAKFTIFVVGLVSFFYALLNLASRAVWVEFLSLNIIADVATKRNNFEMAMTLFFSIFSLLTLLAAIATFVYRASKTTGRWSRTRVYLLVATVMLFIRSLVECVLAFLKHLTPGIHQSDVQLPYDIVYGLLTSLYLFFMYIQAIQVASKNDDGRVDVDNLESDVRNYIIEKLRIVTEQKHIAAPPFRKILDHVKDEVQMILDRGPLSIGSTMTPDDKHQRVENYIRKLRRKHANLGPAAAEPPRPAGPARISRPRDRQSAPPAPMPSSSAYESLRSAANPQVRTANSVPDMRQSSSQSSLRFAPRRTEQNAYGGGGGWPRMAPVEEHPGDSNPPMPNPPAPQGPARRFAPAMPNLPSFGMRAAEAGFGAADGRRAASGPAAAPAPAAAPRGRRVFNVQGPADEMTAPLPPVANQFIPPTPPPAEYAPRPYQAGYPPPQTTPQFDFQTPTGRRNFGRSQYGSQYSSNGESSSQGGQDYASFLQSPTQSYGEPAPQGASYFPPQQQQQQPPRQNYGQSMPSSQSTVNWGYELPEIGPQPGYGGATGQGPGPMAGTSDGVQASRNAPPQQFQQFQYHEQ